MINIYDSANQLTSDLQKTDEYVALKQAVKEVEENAESLALFTRMLKLEEKMAKLKDPSQGLTDTQKKEYADVSKEIEKDKHITKMLMAEQQIYNIIEEIEKTITTPIRNLYSTLKESKS